MALNKNIYTLKYYDDFEILKIDVKNSAGYERMAKIRDVTEECQDTVSPPSRLSWARLEWINWASGLCTRR